MRGDGPLTDSAFAALVVGNWFAALRPPPQDGVIRLRGYIPAMVREAGATDEEVDAVRRADRAAQGVTAAMEAAAVRDLAENAEFSTTSSSVKVWCPEGSSSAHADALFAKAKAVLLMGPREWNYYGPGHLELAGLFDDSDSGGDSRGETGAAGAPRYWAGGAAESGYFGMAEPDEAAQRKILGWFDKGASLY